MIKRARANRTEKATYRNNRNEHKFIDVVHHGDGHYYMIQYIKHELPERTVVNYMGTRCGHKQKFRIGKATLMGILEELSSKAKMQQTVASALKILDEYEFQSVNITEAIELLKKEAEKLDGEIEDLMDSAAGGKLDFEKAFEEE